MRAPVSNSPRVAAAVAMESCGATAAAAAAAAWAAAAAEDDDDDDGVVVVVVALMLFCGGATIGVVCGCCWRVDVGNCW